MFDRAKVVCFDLCILLQMLENLCKHHQVLNNNTVTLENTAIMVTAVKA